MKAFLMVNDPADVLTVYISSSKGDTQLLINETNLLPHYVLALLRVTECCTFPWAGQRQGVSAASAKAAYTGANSIAKASPLRLVIRGIFSVKHSWEEDDSGKTHCQAWQQTMHCRDVICIKLEANQAAMKINKRELTGISSMVNSTVAQ